MSTERTSPHIQLGAPIIPRASGIACALLIATLFSCGGEQSQTELADENPQPPAPLAWSLEVASEPRVLELTGHRTLVTQASGARLLAIDTAGAIVGSFGREGAGPGEFGLAGAIAVLAGERIGVIDPTLRRLTVLDSALGYLSSVDMPPSHEAFSAQVLADGSWLSLYPGVGDRADSSRLLRSAAGSRAIRDIASVHVPVTTFVPLGDIAFNFTPEYHPRDIWGTMPNGEVWIARGGANRVDWYLADGTVEIGEAIPFPTIRTVPEDLDRWRGLPAPEALGRVRAQRPMSRVKGPFQHVVAAPSGELWFWLNQPHGYRSELYVCRARSGETRDTVSVPYGSKLIHVGHRLWYFYYLSHDKEVEELRAYVRPPCGIGTR